jgi:hypothetical protein
MYGGDRRQLAVRTVEVDQLVERDVGDPVAVGHHERPVAEMVASLHHPSGGLGALARLDEVDAPRFVVLVVADDRSVAQLHREVAGQRAVLREVLLDVLTLVAERDDELVESAPAVGLHDVPEDRLPTDLDHRLGPDLGLLGQARAEAARQNQSLHDVVLHSRSSPGPPPDSDRQSRRRPAPVSRHPPRSRADPYGR